MRGEGDYENESFPSTFVRSEDSISIQKSRRSTSELSIWSTCAQNHIPSQSLRYALLHFRVTRGPTCPAHACPRAHTHMRTNRVHTDMDTQTRTKTSPLPLMRAHAHTHFPPLRSAPLRPAPPRPSPPLPARPEVRTSEMLDGPRPPAYPKRSGGGGGGGNDVGRTPRPQDESNSMLQVSRNLRCRCSSSIREHSG